MAGVGSPLYNGDNKPSPGEHILIPTSLRLWKIVSHPSSKLEKLIDIGDAMRVGENQLASVGVPCETLDSGK